MARLDCEGPDMNRSIVLAAVLFAAIAAPGGAAPGTRATIMLESYRYTPAPVDLAGGVPVRLLLVNRSGKPHDFTAPAFFASAQMIGGPVPGGKIRLGAGRRAAIDLVPRRGTYKVHCTQFGHKMLGMSTVIIVL